MLRTHYAFAYLTRERLNPREPSLTEYTMHLFERPFTALVTHHVKSRDNLQSGATRAQILVVNAHCLLFVSQSITRGDEKAIQFFHIGLYFL